MQEWFDAYGVSHQNETNKLIHWICVPSIFFSVLGLLACIPSDFVAQYFPERVAPFVHFGTLVVLLGLIFFIRLSWTISLGMLALSVAFLLGQNALLHSDIAPLWLVNLVIFVVAWIGQFIGHKIEGAKPSFFEDLQYLMIGPAWLIHFIYKRIGVPI